MKFLIFLSLLFAVSAQAAPRCLALNAQQAAQAVKVVKLALYQRGWVRLVSKNAGGVERPLGIWAERKAGLTGPNTYRVRVDGLEVDISLVYVQMTDEEHSPNLNLAWLSGCKSDKPQRLMF